MAANEKTGYIIEKATEGERSEIMALYKAQIGREFCPWDEDYPSDETMDWDYSRDALFVLKADGKIRAAISIEKDESVDKLTCWDKSLEPEGELARAYTARRQSISSMSPAVCWLREPSFSP